MDARVRANGPGWCQPLAEDTGRQLPAEGTMDKCTRRNWIVGAAHPGAPPASSSSIPGVLADGALACADAYRRLAAAHTVSGRHSRSTPRARGSTSSRPSSPTRRWPRRCWWPWRACWCAASTGGRPPRAAARFRQDRRGGSEGVGGHQHAAPRRAIAASATSRWRLTRQPLACCSPIALLARPRRACRLRDRRFRSRGQGSRSSLTRPA
jgi:hypothetical protein